MNLNKVCDLADFSSPPVRDTLRAIFAHRVAAHPEYPQGQEDMHHWAMAMSVLALQAANE